MDLGRGLWGYELTQPGEEFDLAEIEGNEFNAPDLALAGTYFRTKSGNTYYLDSLGYLINGNEGQEFGVYSVYRLDYASQSGKLVVDQRFKSGFMVQGGQVGEIETSPLTEIVPIANGIMENRAQLKLITEGRSNDVAERFKTSVASAVRSRNRISLHHFFGEEAVERHQRDIAAFERQLQGQGT
ncbi:hypothetical protein HY025_03540 [Candidatus Daviesbacteria bacterium]|nr:hypothetical protein [Candidatus Daviesbacteria bacterium]